MDQKSAQIFRGLFFFFLICGSFSPVSAAAASQKKAGPEGEAPAATAPGVAAEPAVQPGTPVPTAKNPSPSWSDGWYQGAEGYATALAEYEKTNKPMAVYVSVDWCPYCRKFEKQVLSSPAVQEFLKDKIKVNINPESSKKENGIAFQYGVTGFPSFYVHPPQPSGTVRLYTGVSPEEFIKLFEQVVK